MNKKKTVFTITILLKTTFMYAALSIAEREVASTIASSRGFSEALTEFIETVRSPAQPEEKSLVPSDEQVDEIIAEYNQQRLARELGDIERDIHQRTTDAQKTEPEETNWSSDEDSSTLPHYTYEPGVPISETWLGRTAISGWNMIKSATINLGNWFRKKSERTLSVTPQPTTYVIPVTVPAKTGILTRSLQKSQLPYKYHPAFLTSSGMFRTTTPRLDAKKAISEEKIRISHPHDQAIIPFLSASLPHDRAKNQTDKPSISPIQISFPKAKKAKHRPKAKNHTPISERVHPGHIPQLTTSLLLPNDLTAKSNYVVDHKDSSSHDFDDTDLTDKKEEDTAKEMDPYTKNAIEKKQYKAASKEYIRKPITISKSVHPKTLESYKKYISNQNISETHPLTSNQTEEPSTYQNEPINDAVSITIDKQLPTSPSNHPTSTTEPKYYTYEDYLGIPPEISERSKIMSPEAPIK